MHFHRSIKITSHQEATKPQKTMFFISFLLIEGRIRIHKNITDPDPGSPRTYGSFGSGTLVLPVSTDSVSLARGVSFMICRPSKGSCVDVSRMLEQSTSLKCRPVIRIKLHHSDNVALFSSQSVLAPMRIWIQRYSSMRIRMRTLIRILLRILHELVLILILNINFTFVLLSCTRKCVRLYYSSLYYIMTRN
jgi:hypothetical protein